MTLAADEHEACDQRRKSRGLGSNFGSNLSEPELI